MPNKLPHQPRKAPLQRRSQETVDAILEATAHILSQEGLEKATTNRIAAKAGVSIGSLYQYFPNKESLVRALNDRHIHELLDLLRTRVAEVWDAPLEVAVKGVVRAMVDAHRVDPELHRVLVIATPAVGALEETRRVEEEAEALVLRFLKFRQAELRPLEPALSAFMLVHSVEALTHAAVLEYPDLLNGESFVEETTRMILGYLQPTPSEVPGSHASREKLRDS